MNDFSTTGDGVMTALQILACLRSTETELDDYANLYEKTPQYHCNYHFQRQKNPLNDAKLAQEIDKQHARLSEKNARLIVRASGTEPIIRITAEGKDEALIKSCVDELHAMMQKTG